jgi:hypothetical protein
MVSEGTTMGKTWLQVGLANAGLSTALKGLTWAFCWAIARQAIGSSPSAEEVAEWWSDSHRSTYRHQAAFRKSFPVLDGPASMFEPPEAILLLQRSFRGVSRADVERHWKKRFIEEGVVNLGHLPAAATSSTPRSFKR